jgi:hypothetical protein
LLRNHLSPHILLTPGYPFSQQSACEKKAKKSRPEPPGKKAKKREKKERKTDLKKDAEHNFAERG